MSSRSDSPARVLLATRSSGKLRELQAMFAEAGIDVIDLDAAGIRASVGEEALESEETFEENALAKARYFHRISGIATVADDSGLEVSALGGAPGIYSKRWSGRPDLHDQALDDANNAFLLQKLEAHDDRRALYVCAAALCDDTGEYAERGEARGRISRVARGTGGFGYDPYFISDELGRTFADVTAAEKARVSHRARAFANLLRRMTRER